MTAGAAKGFPKGFFTLFLNGKPEWPRILSRRFANLFDPAPQVE